MEPLLNSLRTHTNTQHGGNCQSAFTGSRPVLQARKKPAPWARGKAAPFQRKGSRPGNAGRPESSASAPKASFAPGSQSPLPFTHTHTPSPKWGRGAMQPPGTFARLARGKRGPGGGPLWGCLPAPVQARHGAGTGPDPPAASPGRSGAPPGD